MSVPGLRLLCGEPENYSSAGLAAAASLGECHAETLDQEAFEREAPGYDVWLVRLRLRVPAPLVEAAPMLKAVVSPTTGLNHLALDALRERHIPVFHLRGETAFLETITSTAEHAFGLLLGLMRRIPAAASSVQQGQWVQQPFRGHELKGKRLGILGYGRLGRMVARYGSAFGMEVLAYDPVWREPAEYVRKCSSVDDLLRQADILSIHVPLHEGTEGLLGRHALSLLPRGAVVVNTSRGEIVDESAVLERLESGALGGYATDVLRGEHAISDEGHPLITWAQSHDNVLITPHIGGAAEEAIEQTDLFVLRKLEDWWRGATAVSGQSWVSAT